MPVDRRDFIRLSGLTTLAAALPTLGCNSRESQPPAPPEVTPDYTLRIASSRVELGPDRVVSTTTYNGQFPGPLLRLKDGQRVVVDVHNDTDTPEQLHWHGQFVPVDVDGAAEEGTPFIPARGMRRIGFTPGPAGFRFYHTHVRAGGDLNQGQYSGLVGPVYIEPKSNPGAYDREVFVVLKEFEPSLSRGGDMAMDFMAQRTEVAALKARGESAMHRSVASGTPHGFEVGYRTFTINGRMLGTGEPIRVKANERMLLHVLNGSATEIRSLALPGHTFRVVALDGNLVATPADVPVLWIGTGERVSAVVEMNHPGIWVLGDLSDDDRQNGMGIVVEYADRTGKPEWVKPKPSRWDYTSFAGQVAAPSPDETFEMMIEKDNAADAGFNRWTINGVPFAMDKPAAMFHLQHGKRYRLRLRNASDDIHPIHFHRHTMELTRIGGAATAGVKKDVFMLSGYQDMELDFIADQPGLSLFHCHQQLHMDFGFMCLFDCV